MVDRRTLFSGALASAVAADRVAHAANSGAHKSAVYDVEPRGEVGIFERISSLNVEGQLDFHTGYRRWMSAKLLRTANARSIELLKANGIDPATDAPIEDIVAVLTADQTVAMYLHNWERTQEAMWKIIKDECDRNDDALLDEMARAEKAGPGTLVLNKGLEIPDYACYEIHIQPGGYVGDRFAGHIYYYGTMVVVGGGAGNYQDNFQYSLAAALPPPADGKIRRILEQGTSCGQYAVALKRRFPEAEVWADDVAGPMLRYAHMRTAQMGVDVRYVQGLSEKSQFPDNHFDMVTNNLLIHEVPAQQIKDIAAEAYRTLRPGGVFYPLDSYSGDQPRNTALSKYAAWRSYRWNHEVWWMEYYGLDLAQAMRDVGFKVDENGPKGRGDTTRNVVGYKI